MHDRFMLTRVVEIDERRCRWHVPRATSDGVRSLKWMHYSCTRMATVGFKGLTAFVEHCNHMISPTLLSVSISQTVLENSYRL